MFERKGINYKEQLSEFKKRMIELEEQYGNPDRYGNFISYCVNGTWYIRDKAKSNKIVEKFKSECEYLNWINDILYDD